MVWLGEASLIERLHFISGLQLCYSAQKISVPVSTYNRTVEEESARVTYPSDILLSSNKNSVLAAEAEEAIFGSVKRF
jgi:hypothetical protein